MGVTASVNTLYFDKHGALELNAADVYGGKDRMLRESMS